MSATRNKQALQTAFAGMAEGDPSAFVALMADDFAWEIPGTSTWAGRWEGKRTVRAELFGPLFEQFAGPYRNRALRFVAEDDLVVVECRGDVATKAGGRYDNTYCYVCRFADGRMVELTEYMDTALADRVLDPPPVKPAPPLR